MPRRLTREQNLGAIRAEHPILAQILEQEEHSDRAVGQVRQSLESAKNRRFGDLGAKNTAQVLISGALAGVLKKGSLGRIAPVVRKTFDTLAGKGYSPRIIGAPLWTGFVDRRGIRPANETELRLFLEGVQKAARNRWSPGIIAKSAMAANRTVGNLEETLRIQRRIIDQGITPTEERILGLWRDKRR